MKLQIGGRFENRLWACAGDYSKYHETTDALSAPAPIRAKLEMRRSRLAYTSFCIRPPIALPYGRVGPVSLSLIRVEVVRAPVPRNGPSPRLVSDDFPAPLRMATALAEPGTAGQETGTTLRSPPRQTAAPPHESSPRARVTHTASGKLFWLNMHRNNGALGSGTNDVVRDGNLARPLRISAAHDVLTDQGGHSRHPVQNTAFTTSTMLRNMSGSSVIGRARATSQARSAGMPCLINVAA